MSTGCSPQEGREPVNKCKSLAAVTAELAVLRKLEEAEVDPGDEEAKLDENERRGAQNDGEDVGDQEVDTGKRLLSALVKRATHLDADLDKTEYLHLMLRDELSKGNEEADLKGGQAVEWGAEPGRLALRLKLEGNSQEEILVTEHEPLDPAEAECDGVAGGNDDEAEADEFLGTPQLLEIPSGERQSNEGDDELHGSASVK